MLMGFYNCRFITSNYRFGLRDHLYGIRSTEADIRVKGKNETDAEGGAIQTAAAVIVEQ
jgi:hypothetical protein